MLYCRFVYGAALACLEPIAVPALVHLLQHQFCIHFLKSDNSIKRDSCTCLLINDTYCSICLGILLPACHQDEGTETPNVASHINNISSMISEVVQRESYQFDKFSLEISLPPLVAANERAIR
jgi:hypothetical protein